MFRSGGRFSRRPQPPPGPPISENPTRLRADGCRGLRSRWYRALTPLHCGYLRASMPRGNRGNHPAVTGMADPAPRPSSHYGPTHAEKNREVCIQRSRRGNIVPRGGVPFGNAAVILRTRSRTKPWRFVWRAPLAIRGRPRPAPGRPAARGASRRNRSCGSAGVAPSDFARPAPRPAASEKPLKSR